VAPKILIIGIDNRSNLKYRKRLLKFFPSNIVQPFYSVHDPYMLLLYSAGAWRKTGQYGALAALPSREPVLIAEVQRKHVHERASKREGGREQETASVFRSQPTLLPLSRFLPWEQCENEPTA
jgi:hypothetical protein